MSDQKKMSELLFPDIKNTAEYYENQYPPRDLPEGAKVTRFAPSPTGFLHIGGLFAAFVCKRAADATGGVFMLRIEDTDKKREIADGVSLIIDGLKDFGIEADEGVISKDEASGAYGPYIQSQRKEIYQTYAKQLVAQGLAYPCFYTEEELQEIRRIQEEKKLNPGCYGEFAKYRDITFEEAKKRIEAGEHYVVRLKSPGKEGSRVKFKDGIRGEIEMPENTQDVVILKSDGIPTYHFAHAVDDHLMRTTDVIRGDEWISSVPIHLQFFRVLGFKPPRYSHIAPIMKEEDGGKRKLSKRKDPEAAVSYYAEMGYPPGAVTEYLLTIANSNYEQWRDCNKTADNREFKFSLNKMSKAGALFDLVKLNDISKNYISTLSTETVYQQVSKWAAEYAPDFYALLQKDPAYARKIFGIERENAKPRKELVKWNEAPAYCAYFFRELWDGQRDFPQNLSKEDMIQIIEAYQARYQEDDTQEGWFERLRGMGEELGYARAPKLYKKDPESFKGHVGDVSSVIRVAVTGRKNTPDLYEILQVLGRDEVMKRLDEAVQELKK